MILKKSFVFVLIMEWREAHALAKIGLAGQVYHVKCARFIETIHAQRAVCEMAVGCVFLQAVRVVSEAKQTAREMLEELKVH